MKRYFDWTIEREEESFDVSVEGTFRHGTSDSYWEPGDPPEFELEKVEYMGKPFETTQEEDESIILWALENTPDDYDDYDY